MALVLLTHCGGGNPMEAAHEEVGPQEPATIQQEVSTTRNFAAIADARLNAAEPTRNFGGASTLVADLSPRQESYLRFTVSGVTGRVTRAVLRLYATDGTSDGPRVFSTSGFWTEGEITWNNRPAPSGSALDDTGAIASRTWVELNVTGAVRGNGEYNLVLVGTSGDGTNFASRENSQTSLRPQLVLTVEPAPTPDCMPSTDTWSSDVEPIADGYASQSEPTRHFGDAPVLKVDGSPRLESYLQFGFSFPDEWHVRGAKLRLFATDETSNGPRLYRASNEWPAWDFDWNTRPPLLGPPVGYAGPITANTWVEYDVTAVVPESGAYSFGLLPESTNGVDFVSKDEASEHAPRLRLAVETDTFCTYRGTGGGLTGWVRQLGGMGPEVLHALATDTTGAFVAAGRFGDAPFPNGSGFALSRYTADGTPVWTRQVTTGNVWVKALTVTPLGNILVVGQYGGAPDLGTGPLPVAPDYGDSALFIAKFSPTGQTEWAHGFLATYVRPPDNELENWPVFPMAVATDAQGSLIVGGLFQGLMDLGGGPLFAGLDSVSEYDSSPGGFLAKFSWEGRHLWSKAFQGRDSEVMALSTDGAGNILVGGAVGRNADLGDGLPGEAGPFIAKYTPSGALQWKRLFRGADGDVVGVQPLGTSSVAFVANLGRTFTFRGQTYTGGDPSVPPFPENVSGFTGTLSTSGGDGWLRALGLTTTHGLVTGSGGTFTITGRGSAFDLGGGVLGTGVSGRWRPYVARYSSSGGPLWSRAFDKNLEGESYGQKLFLAPQPGDAVVLGGDFTEPVLLDSSTHLSRGASDLLYFQLKP
ncbi:DNRLRE domain-containing protein [Vitiosangium sp. GDMCC 1.1324]|uniref:CBM96 family carbohydrate-binding protein n=1 Tax=Vitiosangium sp. (strain GDMCC 1.1324) TaxID=2138576 RepID=UPI00130DCF88|nr:DNRLRE domain-containing protein [Vitiosangium sp. GDMCC 1.1324]